MRTAILIRLNAAVCGALSMLALFVFVYFTLAAPGYLRQLSLSNFGALSVYAATAVCGIVTSVGLFLRKPWAMVSIQIIAAVWTLEGLLGIVTLVGNGQWGVVSWASFGQSVAVILIGVSWIAFFRSRNAKEEFAPAERARA